jgi:hypothetical protein
MRLFQRKLGRHAMLACTGNGPRLRRSGASGMERDSYAAERHAPKPLLVKTHLLWQSGQRTWNLVLRHHQHLKHNEANLHQKSYRDYRRWSTSRPCIFQSGSRRIGRGMKGLGRQFGPAFPALNEQTIVLPPAVSTHLHVSKVPVPAGIANSNSPAPVHRARPRPRQERSEVLLMSRPSSPIMESGLRTRLRLRIGRRSCRFGTGRLLDASAATCCDFTGSIWPKKFNPCSNAPKVFAALYF